MSSLISKVNTFSDEEKLSVLQQNFSSQELIEILDELFKLDPKQKSPFDLFDCCGTGGDRANTFNISTSSAIIAASTGIKTCKNGGRSSSSKTGSVDVLEELGVNFSQSLEKKLIGLKKYGLAFHASAAIAQTLAPLKNYARANKICSFLSLLGPFTNPFILKGQIIGIGQKDWFEKVTALAQHQVNQGFTKQIALVQSIDNNGQVFDELTSITKAKIRIIKTSDSFDYEFKPTDFDLNPGDTKLLCGGESHQENAQILESILKNEAHEIMKETCLINVALMLCLNLDDLTLENIKENLQSSYLKAKTQLEDAKSLQNWQDFLAFNQANN